MVLHELWRNLSGFFRSFLLHPPLRKQQAGTSHPSILICRDGVGAGRESQRLSDQWHAWLTSGHARSRHVKLTNLQSPGSRLFVRAISMLGPGLGRQFRRALRGSRDRCLGKELLPSHMKTAAAPAAVWHKTEVMRRWRVARIQNPSAMQCSSAARRLE